MAQIWFISSDGIHRLGNTVLVGRDSCQCGAFQFQQPRPTLLLFLRQVVSAICWVPNRKGVVACACTDPASQTERLATMGRLSPAYILVWNFRDPIHPEYVMESPHEVFSFQFNPLNPDIVVGGCYNGQIVVWDTDGCERNQAGKGGGSGARGAVGNWEEGAGEEAVTPVIRHK